MPLPTQVVRECTRRATMKEKNLQTPAATKYATLECNAETTLQSEIDKSFLQAHLSVPRWMVP